MFEIHHLNSGNVAAELGRHQVLSIKVRTGICLQEKTERNENFASFPRNSKTYMDCYNKN